ncbi:MAG: hypothetical protein Q8R20_00085 [Nanoarchaeota archaeon]|nr:hypothetical protein [Nanoarchaeota archaeon]
MFLAILHLEIEHFPRKDFTEEEAFMKCESLMGMIGGKNVHLNLSYAATQLEDRKEREKSVRV